MSCDTICVSIRLHIFPIAHFMLECFFLFCSFFSPIFVVVLFHFSMCHALRFRSRCINTQFNREFERHLFTYLWFRLKIWKYKFHAYKLEAQSSFFIFRQWVYLFIAYVQIVFHVWSKFQIYTSMVYVGGWLVGWLVGCVYAFVCSSVNKFLVICWLLFFCTLTMSHCKIVVCVWPVVAIKFDFTHDKYMPAV